MIPQRYAPLLFSCFMSLFMCTVMSFAMTCIFTGFMTPGFMERWMLAFGYALIIATPLVFIAQPLIRKCVHYLVKES